MGDYFSINPGERGEGAFGGQRGEAALWGPRSPAAQLRRLREVTSQGSAFSMCLGETLLTYHRFFYGASETKYMKHF